MISYPVLANKGTIKLDNQNEGSEMYNLLQTTYEVPSTFDYQLVVVDSKYIARPDLLSLELYGSVNFADVLCKLNNISNPFELNDGMIIVAPNIVDIQQFYKVSNKDDSSTLTSMDASTSVVNVQKKKNEKRKANEQVIGDSNFRIDKSNKIVIY